MTDRESRYPGRYRAVMSASDVSNMQAGNQFNITMVRDDDPIDAGTPYSKDTILPDSLVEYLGADKSNIVTLADFLNVMVTNDKANSSGLEEVKEALENMEASGGMTDGELAAKVEDIVVSDLTGGGNIHTGVATTARNISVEALQEFELVVEDANTPGLYNTNVPTNEMLEDRILYAIDSAAAETSYQVEYIFNSMYTKNEVDAQIGETESDLKAYIEETILGGAW